MAAHRDPALRDNVILWAKNILSHKEDYVLLDTETTGLSNNDVIIQISIIDLDGNELLNTLVKPTRVTQIPAAATAVHGIEISGLKDAPAFFELIPRIKEILSGKTVLIYNAEFDKRLIAQTCAQDGCAGLHLKTQCVMQQYSLFVGNWSDYHRNYAYQRLPAGDHSATGDCHATLKVLRQMAEAALSMP